MKKDDNRLEMRAYDNNDPFGLRKITLGGDTPSIHSGNFNHKAENDQNKLSQEEQRNGKGNGRTGKTPCPD